jgi:glycosyltransferase involved in cell wall biosynthesis
MSRRVLIVTNGHLCRNPRVVKEADALGRAGCHVTVLSLRNHAPSVALDAQLADGAPFRHEEINLLSGAGLKAFRRRLVVWGARQAVGRLGWQALSALGPAGSLLRRARRHDADLIIVHNELAHGVGLRLHAEGRLVRADIEDWHSEDLLPGDRQQRPMELLRRQESGLLNRLPGTSTTSHALADALHARYGGIRPQVITNSFPLQADPRTARDRPAEAPSFFWFSQRLGPGRGLEQFLAAWQLTTRPSRVVLLGEPAAGYREELLASLPPTRRPAVAFLDCVPPAALPSLIARHDIGLALEGSELPSRNLTITNKILQYLNAGLAVVASDTAGQREVLAQGPDAGVLVRPTGSAEFAAALDALLGSSERLSHRQHAARQLAETVYCWEREAPRLVALVESALQHRIESPTAG